jgi:hypothetical protein
MLTGEEGLRRVTPQEGDFVKFWVQFADTLAFPNIPNILFFWLCWGGWGVLGVQVRVCVEYGRGGCTQVGDDSKASSKSEDPHFCSS